MPARRRIFDQGREAHFVTFSCFRRRRLLDHHRAKQIFLEVTATQVSRQSACCIGYVVMPDHVHAILWFAEPGQLSRFMQIWKRRSAYELKSWYRRGGVQYLDFMQSHDPFWQSKYYSFEIETEGKLVEKLNYMHRNPVRAGLVIRAADWEWSSARWYENGTPSGIPVHRLV